MEEEKEVTDSYLEAVIMAEANLISKILFKAIGSEPDQSDFDECEKANLNKTSSGAYQYDLLYCGINMGVIFADYDQNDMIIGFRFIGAKTDSDD